MTGDRIDIGNYHTSGSIGYSPYVWRGAVDASFHGPSATAFTGAIGDTVGGQDLGQSFLQLWTWYDSATNKTNLYADTNRDFTVDAYDFRIAFDAM